MYRFFEWFLVLAIATAAGAAPLSVRPVSIHDPCLSFRGRFDWRDPAGPRCEWAGSTLAVRLRGSALVVRLSANGADRVQIYVDGQPHRIFTPDKGESAYRVVHDLPAGEHLVEVMKATEPLVGRVQFLGVAVPEGTALLEAPAPPAFKLELVGDSITCGFGNEAPDEHHHFSPATENNAIAYGALTARALGADYACIAWSGKKLHPDNTLPELYDRALPTDAASPYDLAAWVPDVILVNLCTNDFGGANPAEEPWVAAYHAFVERLRHRAPRAQIILALGPMMNDTWSRQKNALRAARSYITRVVADCQRVGDARIHFLEFPPQGPADGFGADWHPSAGMHRRMAAQLTTYLRALPR